MTETGAVASAREVLERITELMRGDSKDNMKALEMLAKHYGLLTERETVAAVPVIVDDVRAEETQ